MIEEDEFIDCAYSVGLALAIARKFNEPLDKAVSNACFNVAMRARFQRVRNLFNGIGRDENPPAAFTLIASQVFPPGAVVPVVSQ